MKKSVLFAISILAIFVLNGCGNSNANMKVNDDQPLTKVGQ